LKRPSTSIGGTLSRFGTTLVCNQLMAYCFGVLDYAKTMRLVVPGATLTAPGFQTILFSLFVTLLGMRRR